MRDMAGGSYLRSLRLTFLPELLSMNLLMAGMYPTMHWLMPHVPGANNPVTAGFWFVMSMALLVGFVLAYPINWWLVATRLKHGMITVRPAGQSAYGPRFATDGSAEHDQTGSPRTRQHDAGGASIAARIGMAILTTACLALGVALAG
jgi:Domain of unknown function (DUF4396)